MANVGTPNYAGPTMQIIGIAGAADNQVVAELENAERYNEFTLMSSAGEMDVDVSLDGVNFAVAIAIEDLHSLTPATRVVVTAADLVYRFQGTFKTVRVRQETNNVADAILYCSQNGRG